MYVCTFCKMIVGPGLKMQKHTTYRQNKQIANEVPICKECKVRTELGIRLSLPPILLIGEKDESMSGSNIALIQLAHAKLRSRFRTQPMGSNGRE